MNRLREFREIAGLSQKELASKIGASQQSISYLESGERDGRLSTWRKICDVLNVNMSELLPKLWEKP